MAAVLVTSCGGSEDDTAVVVYDESRDGPLPFALDFLPPADLLKYTVQVSVGTNIVKGNSDTGEAILLTVPAGTYIQSVGINFANHVDANALVTLVERFPYDGASFIDGHPMPSTGQYTYAVVAPTNGVRWRSICASHQHGSVGRLRTQRVFARSSCGSSVGLLRDDSKETHHGIPSSLFSEQ
jgi:hypothetical protein